MTSKNTHLQFLSEEYIQDFSRTVHLRDYENATKMLFNIFDALDIGGIGLVATVGRHENSRILSQLASSITSLFCDYGFQPSEQGLSVLFVARPHLRSIFENSGFQNMGHIQSIVGSKQGQTLSFPDDKSLVKYLITCALNQRVDLSILKRVIPGLRLSFWLGLMEARTIIDEKETANRHDLMMLGISELRESKIRFAWEMAAVSRLWMQCSYWADEQKHQTKMLLNTLIRNTFELHQGVGEKVVPQSDNTRIEKISGKPRLLIVVEAWGDEHSMLRCYSTAIATLRSRFYVVALIQNGMTSRLDDALFNQVVEFSQAMAVGAVIELMTDQKPDLVYYPSIGMNSIVVQLCQFRIAPVQLMTAGHPASSFSNEIDYMVLEEDMLGDPATVAEQVLLTSSDSFRYVRPITGVVKQRSENGKICIAITSSYPKISIEFLKTLAEIEQASEQPIIFKLLIGLNAFNRTAIENIVQQHITAECFQLIPYRKYMKELATCDIQIAPFPFGNANGFADAMHLGIPVFCVEGAEVHSKTDSAWSRRVGLSDFCIAQSPQELVERVVGCINNQSTREEVLKNVRDDLDLDALFTQTGMVNNDFRNLLLWVLDQHEKIKKSGQAVWSVNDRMSTQESQRV